MSRNVRFIFAVVLLIAGALVACAPAAAPIPQITIKAHDYAFEGPSQVNAGLVNIKLVNDGHEPHHAQLVRLNDGVTMEQLQKAMRENPESALGLVTEAGGPSVIEPGQSGEVIVDLLAGQYLLLCFIPSADSVPHMAKGMIAPLTVTANNAPAAQSPKENLTVTMSDYAFAFSGVVKAGEQTWKVVNNGPQPHEIALIKLTDGKTVEDAFAWFAAPSGPPPYQYAGGFQGIPTGKSGWVKLNLTPGTYVAVCAIPDTADGKSHAEHGMVLPFTVN